MPSEADGSRAILRAAFAIEGGLGVIALAIGMFLARRPLDQIQWTAAGAGLGLLAACPMLFALWLMTRWPVGPLAQLDALVRRLVVPLFRQSATWELLVVSAMAGFGEELLFRGVAQTGIEQLTGSPWLAIVAAAAIFGLAHPISVTYAVLAGVIGLYLGWLLLASENLLVPIVAHAAYDFLALEYLLYRERGTEEPDSLAGTPDFNAARDI